MRSRIIKSICVGLVLALFLTLCPVWAADADRTLDARVQALGDYCFAALKEPAYGTEWFLYCFKAAGYDVPSDFISAYYSDLEDSLRARRGVLDERRYTEYARVVLALTALGYDPTLVTGYDLLLPLADLDAVTKQGVNGAVFALLALDAANYEVPDAERGTPQIERGKKTQATREKYVSFLLESQQADGGFAVSGSRTDHDMTAMALQALAKYRGRPDVDAAVAKALSYLSAGQHTDGGFDNWGTENAESTAQVILALCELGIDVRDPRFVKNGKSALDALLSYENKDGGFRHISDGKTDMLATRQAYMALIALQRVQNGEKTFYKIWDRPLFSDIAGAPHRAEIEELARAGLFSGRGDGTFDPGATMTRAEFATLIVRAISAEPHTIDVFRDVPADAWYSPYIGAAYDSGIIRGVSATEFRPDGTITDSEAEVMVARTARLLGLQPTTSEVWHASSVRITRGEVAWLLYVLFTDAGLI